MGGWNKKWKDDGSVQIMEDSEKYDKVVNNVLKFKLQF